jgi:hypothetical protein
VLAQSSTKQGGQGSQEESDTGADTGAARQAHQKPILSLPKLAKYSSILYIEI